jgi:hypothetical protein
MPPNNKSNINKFETKADIKHNKKYDYSKSIYIDQNTDIIIFCTLCKNTFKQKPKAHLSGSGCPNCARINHRTTNEEFIKNSQKIHGDSTFNYDECKYTGCKKSVILICNNCQNKFSIVPNKHLSRKQGCSVCCKNNMDKIYFEKSEKLFWEQVNNIHGTEYDLSITKYNGVHENIEVICKKHGVFSIREDTFRRGSGCYECVYIKNKHKEGSLNNINNNSENWKLCNESNLYFSPYYQYAYNNRQNSNLYPNSDGKLSNGLMFIDTLWRIFNGDIPNTKYVTFIDENNIHDKYLLQNITLAEYICVECNNIFIGYNKISLYCSKNCQNSNKMLKETLKKQNIFKYYILGKLSHIKQREKQKNKLELEYDINNFLHSKIWNNGNCSCNWCGLSDLDFADNNIQNPNKLTIDSINPPYHNKFEDLVPSCLMCNRMLNDINLKDRLNLINYLTGKNDLDLSNLTYSEYDKKIIDKQRNPWDTIKQERNLKTSKEAKSLFIELYNNQHEKSNILYNYPIFYFKNSIYSCSCDRIIPKNNENYQLIPLFLNYAKNNLSQDEFIIELEKRNYLNNKNVKVILPDNYLNDSYFINKIKNYSKARLGKIRNNNIKITAYYNNSSKQFISLKECAEYFTTCPKTIKNNIHGKTDNYKHKELGVIIFKLS